MSGAVKLAGDTLRQRHLSLNAAVDGVVSGAVHCDEGDATSDAEALVRAAAAGRLRNLSGVLTALQSRDGAVVAAALANSPWLIEPAYAAQLDPEPLHADLLPRMSARAASKLLLYLRCKLRDPDRIFLFYKYYEEKDLQTALKWLPRCPLHYIQQAVEKHHSVITVDIFKRLCERSVTIFEIFFDQKIKSDCSWYTCTPFFNISKFLLNSHTEIYLEYFESITKDSYYRNKFGPRHTEIIMNHCKDRVLDKFCTYKPIIDLETFGKCLGRENLKSFLIGLMDGDNESGITLDNVKTMIKHMPREDKFDILKVCSLKKNFFVYPSIFDTTMFHCESAMPACGKSYCRSASKKQLKSVPVNSSAPYQMYRYAAYNVAFTEVTKLIGAEAAVEERTAMFCVLLNNAGRNQDHVGSLLQYYVDKHMNEPFKYKIYFVNSIISNIDSLKYSEEIYKLLHVLFQSLGVYAENDKSNTTKCVEYIIVYHISRGMVIPEEVQKKYNFNTMQKYQRRLNEEQKSLLFNFLYQYIDSRLAQQGMTTKEELADSVDLMNKLLTLLDDWNKNISDYPAIVKKVKEMIVLSNEKKWLVNVNSLYCKKKEWRKYFVNESLMISQSEDTCLNILKHNPQLLIDHWTAIDILKFTKAKKVNRLLSKLRIYWPDSFALKWIESYQTRLEQGSDEKSAIKGLLTLLPSVKAINFANQHVPENTKIVWSEIDHKKHDIQKAVASSLHVIRPSISPEVIMPFLKGDYVQYALSSLYSVFAGLSREDCRTGILTILNSPVSVQKHGVRFAFAKLTMTELQDTLYKLWMNTKNSTIRSVIFTQTFSLMTKENKRDKTNDAWKLLKMFMDNLLNEENKTIYTTLGNINKVPEHIQAEFLMKSYDFLTSSKIPDKMDVSVALDNLINHASNIAVKLDPHFLERLILKNTEDIFVLNVKKMCCHTSLFRFGKLVATFMIFASTEKDRIERSVRVLLPIVKNAILKFNVYCNDDIFKLGNMYLQILHKNLIEQIIGNFNRVDLMGAAGLFTCVIQELETNLSDVEHYVLLRSWRLNSLFLTSLASEYMKEDNSTSENHGDDDKEPITPAELTWNQLCIKGIDGCADKCIDLLLKDIGKLFPLYILLFRKALQEVFNIGVYGPTEIRLQLLKAVLEKTSDVNVYLMVLESMPLNCDHSIVKEIRNLFSSHSSTEVKMHYYDTLRNKNI